MRGRYLSLQLTVDGCQSTLPSAFKPNFPRNSDGTTRKGGFRQLAGSRSVPRQTQGGK